MNKERTYVSRRRVKQIEDTINTILGENLGHRKVMQELTKLIARNKRRIRSLQKDIKIEKIGKLRGIPVK